MRQRMQSPTSPSICAHGQARWRQQARWSRQIADAVAALVCAPDEKHWAVQPFERPCKIPSTAPMSQRWPPPRWPPGVPRPANALATYRPHCTGAAMTQPTTLEGNTRMPTQAARLLPSTAVLEGTCANHGHCGSGMNNPHTHRAMDGGQYTFGPALRTQRF